MTPPTHHLYHTVMIMRKILEKSSIVVRDCRYLGGGVMTPPYNGVW